MNTVVITGKGASPREVRSEAELKVEQVLDLSMLSTLLISEKTASSGDFYDYLDIYFRDPSSPITAKLVVVSGDVKPFFDLSQQWKSESGAYYQRLIKSFEEASFVVPYTMQTASTILFETAKDLVLPYLKMDEELGRPVGEGVALFSGRSFSGETLNPQQSILLNILNESIGQVARLSYIYEGHPLSIRIVETKRNLDISDQINIMNKIDVAIVEFPQDNLKSKKKRDKIDQFLTEQITKDMEAVIKKLQDAKCDAIGLGQITRAYHTKYYEENWHEKFSTMNITTEIKLNVVETGILY